MMYGDTEPVGTGIRRQPTTGRRKYPSKGKRGSRVSNPPAESREARYARLASNPNTRRDVPDQYLSPEQRRQRLLNRRLDSPVAEGVRTTNRDVAREARADANIRYGQQESDLRNQYAKSAVQMTRLPAYMEQYRAALASAQQQAQGAYQQAAAQARGGQDAANTAQSQGQIVSQMQADAAARGGSVDPALLQQAIQAAAVRQGRSEIQGQYMDALGAGEQSFYGRGQANIPLRLIEELNRERGVQNELDRTRRQLAGEKGEFLTSQRSKIAERERGYGLEAQVLGLDAAKAEMTAQQKEADRVARQQESRTKRRQQLADKRRDREFREQDREDRQEFQSERDAKKDKNGTGKDSFGNTRKDRQRAQDAYSAAKNIASQLGGNDWKATMNFLISKKKINPVYARAAAMQSVLGYVGPETEKELRRRGVSKGYKRRTKKTGKSVSKAGSGYGGFG